VKKSLAYAAAGEVLTGLALVLVPSIVGPWLLGAPLDAVATQVARVAGLALVGLGIACWPGSPRAGMLIYSGSVAVYLAYLGLVGVTAGVLLWPAVALHVLLTALLARD
jgi:hypothetical protein